MPSRFSQYAALAISLAGLAAPPPSLAGPVRDAALAGNAAEIARLLDAGAEVDEAGIASPLYVAIQRGHTEAAMLLIERGADVNHMSKFGAPLHIAARKGQAEVVLALIERGADPNLAGGEEARTPLHEAAHGGSVEAARLLLEQGADPNAPTRQLEPPIHIATVRGHEAVVRLLVEHGAGPPEIAPIADALATADIEKGRQRAIGCNQCHGLEPGKTGAGPNLWGIVGRPKAALSDFPYSGALRAQEGAWDFEALNRFLAHTTRVVPGTAMERGFEPDRQTRIDLIAYLRTLSDSPVPLP